MGADGRAVPGRSTRVIRATRVEILKASRQPAMLVYILLVAAVAGLAGPLSLAKARSAEEAVKTRPHVTHTFGEAPPPAPEEKEGPAESRGANGFLVLAVSLRLGLLLAAALVLLHAAGLLAGELSGGTLRHVLVRPVTRTDVLLGKTMVVFLTGLALTVVAFAVSFGLGLALGGYGDVLDVRYGTVDRTAGELWAGVMRVLLIAPVALLAIGAFGILFSALFESSSAAVTAAVLAGIALVAANFWLSPVTQGFSFLTWLDRPPGALVSLARGRSDLAPGLSALWPGLVVPIASGFLFFVAARIIFCRRDIHA